MKSKFSALFIISVIAAVFLSGCAGAAARKRAADLTEYFKPLMGTATREDIAKNFGPPAKRDQLGKYEAWYYHKSFGYRGTGSSMLNGTLAAGQAWESYDDITLMFDEKGILADWRVYVQR